MFEILINFHVITTEPVHFIMDVANRLMIAALALRPEGNLS